MLLESPMCIISPMADSSDHHDIYPLSRQAPHDPAESLHFYSPLQHSVFGPPDLTSNLQLYDFRHFTATMACDQNQVDMETFQRLSNSYQPDLQGPLICDKYPMQTLIQEFSNADQTYVTKTVALAASYSQYRPIKGDGQCGWRAVVFGYFESLLDQDLAKAVSEKARLQSFNDTLVAVGYEFNVVEFFVDETMELFDALYHAIESGNRSDQLLLDIFNDENRSNSIVFHFKLLTSATMKLNPEQYEPYLEQPLFDYCQSNVDAFGQEIEQISLQALTDGVIAPARISIIVMYLDRSQGNEVTPHHLVANTDPDWPTITLLYRPGHYDMIYKSAPLQARRVDISTLQNDFIPMNDFGNRIADLQILSHFNENQSMVHQSTGGSYSTLSRTTDVPCAQFCAPFLEQATTAGQHAVSSMPSKSAGSGYDSPYMPSDMSVAAFGTATTDYDVSSPGASCGSYSGGLPPYFPFIHPPMLIPLPQYSASPSAPSPISSLSSALSPRKQELQIRMSQPCYEMGQRHHEILPLETGPFKNSPFNRGHFANPEFQPLMWNAEDDYI